MDDNIDIKEIENLFDLASNYAADYVLYIEKHGLIHRKIEDLQKDKGTITRQKEKVDFYNKGYNCLLKSTHPSYERYNKDITFVLEEIDKEILERILNNIYNDFGDESR